MSRFLRTRQALGALVLAAVAAGCSASGDDTSATAGTTLSPDSTSSDQSSAVAASTNTTVSEALAANLVSHESDDDFAWSDSDVVDITLTGQSAESDSDAVTIDGDTVTITAAGTYQLSGDLNGQVVVNSPDDGIVRLILDGADIASSTTSAIGILDAGETMVVLATGSTNNLADAATYATSSAATDTDADEPNAALFSMADLTITGDGALTVKGNANDGIASKDGLVLNSGDITVDAVDDGIRGKDYLIMEGGSVDVTAGGDGLKADNEDDITAGYIYVSAGKVTVTAGGDGIQAQTDVIVSGGTITVQAGGGRTGSVADGVSAKGIKGDVSVVIGAGTIAVNSADDSIHSNGAVSIVDGDLTLASGDDGIHADVDLTVSGGTLLVSDSYEGLESAAITLAGGDINVTTTDDGINVSSGDSGDQAAGQGGPPDASGNSNDSSLMLTITGGTTVVNAGGDGLDSNGSATMTGGTVVVNGPTESGNGALDVNGTLDVSGGLLLAAGSNGMAVAPETSSAQGWVAATFDSVQPAGTTVHVVSSDGTEIAAYTSSKEFASLVFSSPDITSGSDYTVYVGGDVSGDDVGGMYATGDYTSASKASTVTADVEPAGGMGGGGGGPGGRGPGRNG